jgi:hypothetical protein
VSHTLVGCPLGLRISLFLLLPQHHLFLFRLLLGLLHRLLFLRVFFQPVSALVCQLLQHALKSSGAFKALAYLSAYVSIRAVEGSSTAYIHTHTHILYVYIYRISAHPGHQVMRRGNPHTFHTSTSPLAVLSPFFLRVLKKIIYALTAYTSYTPAFLLPRYLHTLYRADSISRTPAAPSSIPISSINISSQCRFLCIPHEVHFDCTSAAMVQVRRMNYCCPTSCDIFLSPT